jgi:hypothetical protein
VIQAITALLKRRLARPHQVLQLRQTDRQDFRPSHLLEGHEGRFLPSRLLENPLATLPPKVSRIALLVRPDRASPRSQMPSLVFHSRTLRYQIIS